MKAINVEKIKMGKSIKIRTLGGNLSKLLQYLKYPKTGITRPSYGFLDMDETSLNTKCGIEGLSSFRSVLAHDLVYWDPFSLQDTLRKHIF